MKSIEQNMTQQYNNQILSRFGLNKMKDNEFMTDNSKNIQYSLDDETFENLRDIIYRNYGIYFNSNKKYLLVTRIGKILRERNIYDFQSYIKLLISSNLKHELKMLADSVTINETYFFRAKEQLEALEKSIAGEIYNSKTGFQKNSFRIWSAACSSGEEPYTMAILIKEKLQPQYPDIRFQVLATDINSSVLKKARAGIYNYYAVKDVPPQYLMKYFEKKGSYFYIKDEIKRMVSFSSVNLYDQSQMKMQKNFDVIFCANVLIYFDLKSKRKVLEMLHNSLNPGGYLFVGFSESLHGVSDKFKMIHYPKAIVYKKK